MSKKQDNYYKFDDSREMKTKEIIKRLLKYAKPYYKEFIFVIISVLISSFFTSYLNILVGDAIDSLKLNDGFKDVIRISVVFASFIILSTTINLIRGFILNKLSQKILVDIRNEIFSHIESLSLKEIDKTPVGSFVTRVTNDTNSLSELFTSVVVKLISETTILIYALILMIICSPKLSLISSAMFPILIFSTGLFVKLSRRVHRKITFDNSKVNSFVSENLSGIKITQIFNMENKKIKEFDFYSDKLFVSQRNAMLVFAIFRPLINFLFYLSEIIIFYFGSLMVIDDPTGFTTGTLYAFYLCIFNVYNPIQNIAQMFNTLQSAFASAEKIFHVLDTKSSIEISKNPIEANSFEGEIEFKDVWFKYKDEWIIKGISFKILPGQVVSFVGPTGAGKTTILSLIGRYYDPQKGEILIDGINIKDYDIHSLRRNIGEMLQDVFLFTGTIKDNITLRNEDISIDEVIEASKYVNADTFINRFDNKYDEIVKERGNNYSQGQRQLLSFARTIVYKPKMIILDEATSNIDTETEVLIQDSLEKIKTIGTTLMVAHRLSTIQHSDIIMFIDDGKVIESGSHQELLKLKGRYYNLYKLQYD